MDSQTVDARYDELQRKLEPLWKSIGAMNEDEQTIVVVPSITLDATADWGNAMQMFEERFLFLLLLLRQPRARLIYVTSTTVHPSIIDYYLNLLPGVIPSHARARLQMVAPMDGSPRPLSIKLLERPRLLEKIRSLIPDPERAHLVPYNTTEFERDLALALGIPMYGADPRHFHHGTKTGCRRLFEEEGVAHPLGAEDLHSEGDVIEAIGKIRSARPEVTRVIVKLNEGISGLGNAVVDLNGLPPTGASDDRGQVVERIRGMQFESDKLSYEEYMTSMSAKGGIVEEFLGGEEVRSPSVQLRVTPLGVLEILSTHDQLLGGPSGQSYLGCKFPADRAYAEMITREAEKVGMRLAKEGVLGRFALDFLVVKNGASEWEAYAIEINLRKGGTTHPFLTLQFLTDGNYDPSTGIFTAPSGIEKFFVASDHVELESLRGLTPDDLFDIVIRHRLHFDQSRQTGVVFHMMSGLGEFGRVGLTAVEDSREGAEALYERAVRILEEEAETSYAP